VPSIELGSIYPSLFFRVSSIYGVKKKTKKYPVVLSLMGMNIARLRDARGLSQSEFARRFYIDRKHLCNIENGTANPTLNSLARIADGLDVPITDLFKGLDESAPSAYTYNYVTFPDKSAAKSGQSGLASYKGGSAGNSNDSLSL